MCVEASTRGVPMICVYVIIRVCVCVFNLFLTGICVRHRLSGALSVFFLFVHLRV